MEIQPCNDDPSADVQDDQSSSLSNQNWILIAFLCVCFVLHV